MPAEYSIIIVSYNDGKILQNAVKSAMLSNASRIIICAGGERTDWSFLKGIKDSRVILHREIERLGKYRAINTCLSDATGDFVFILGGDLTFGKDIFDDCIRNFKPDIGLVSPSVIPFHASGFVGVIGRLMWRFHDTELRYMSRKGRNAHAGEFIAVRRELLQQIPQVVNDDAYICLSVKEKGMKVVYVPGISVRNFLPSNLKELTMQRIRVNYGHMQLRSFGFDPAVMSTTLFTNLLDFLGIVKMQFKEKPLDAFLLPAAMFVEGLSILVAARLLRKGVNYSTWPILNRPDR